MWNGHFYQIRSLSVYKLEWAKSRNSPSRFKSTWLGHLVDSVCGLRFVVKLRKLHILLIFFNLLLQKQNSTSFFKREYNVCSRLYTSLWKPISKSLNNVWRLCLCSTTLPPWVTNLLKATLFKSLVNKLRVLPIFRLSIFSVDLFLIAQLFAQPVKLSELKVCLPNS